MKFIDMGVTVAIVVAAFVYMIRHFMTGNSGCSSCKNCSKAGNCDTVSLGKQDVPSSKII